MSFYGLQIGSFFYFQRPPNISVQNPSKMSGFMSSHFSPVPFKPYNGSTVILLSMEISILILSPKLEPPCLLRWFLVPLLSYCQTRYTQHHEWRRHISTFSFPSQLSVPTVYPKELVNSRSIYFELSAFASMVEASYYRRKSAVRENFSAVLVDTFYRILFIFFLFYLWTSMQIHLWLCSLALACGSTVGFQRNHSASPFFRKNWVAPPISQIVLKIKNNAAHALQTLENNQANVPNIKKSTIMQQ